MSRDYQRTKRNPWILPHNLYRQTLYAIRDYNRIKEEYEYLIMGQPAEMDGQPKGTQTGDPTAAVAAKAERLHNQLRAIDDAKNVIPKEYLKGVWDNIVYGTAYPTDADRTTYWRHKSHFVYEVAKNRTFL